MKSRDFKLIELEKILMIKFNNINYLDISLTHSSFANQKIQVDYNERMEFLGDAVLELTVSQYLFNNYKRDFALS